MSQGNEVVEGMVKNNSGSRQWSRIRRVKSVIAALTMVGLSVFPALGCSDAVFLNQDEQKFLDAEQALERADLKKFNQLKTELYSFPLYPYLEYKEALRNLDTPSSVEAFFRKYPESYLSSRLRSRWMVWLGANGRWQQYLDVYSEEKSEKFRCYAARARVAVFGSSKETMNEAKELWLKGSSVDDACDPLFKKLYKKGGITIDVRWQRIGLAMGKNNISLARYLSKKLPKKDQAQFGSWMKMHKQAVPTLAKALKWRDSDRNRDIIIHGIKRYSRADTVKAWRQWHDKFKPAFEFSDQQISDVETSLVLRAAWRHKPEAFLWFQLIPDELLNEEAREWRVRSAARAGDWELVDQYVDLLPEEKRQKEQWQYWKARANKQLGNEGIAQQLYLNLVSNTSYYGFLVSDILGQEYTFTNEPVVDEHAARLVENLEVQPAFQRIKALYNLGRNGTAYAEWKYEIDKMSEDQKRVAARLAHNWRWHFTAIVTTAQAGHFSDLDLRFPLLYEKDVERESRHRKVRPSLVYGVMRRESAFKEAAVSPAGALGLMQVMPATARHLTRKLGIKRLSKKQLKTAGHNIKLGTYYLRNVLDQYDGHEILATASYNAGPHRVKKWLPEESELAADVWVDSITFDETRQYVKAVHFYSTIFDWKSDGKVDYRLEDRMRPVSPVRQSTMVSYKK